MNAEEMFDGEVIRAKYIVEHYKESGITTWLYIPEEKKENKMSKTNLEHYKKELKEIFNEYYEEPSEIIREIKDLMGVEIKGYGFQSCTGAILDWMAQPYREPILDDVEREYLSAVIKPYKNKVTFIAKSKDAYEAKYFISIVVNGNYGREAIHLPWFKENTMYKGMKIGKHYTLKELGL